MAVLSTVLALVMAITRLGFAGPAAAYPGFTAKTTAAVTHIITANVYLDFEPGPVGTGFAPITDVLAEPGITIRIGIDGSGPSDLVARTGTLQFSLDNSARNSVGRVGAYSPYHVNKVSGWGLGRRCRLQLEDPNTFERTVRFIGSIDAIDPVAGQYTSVAVTVTDWMDEAARWTLTPDIGEQVSKTGDEILTAILAQMPRQPAATLFDAGDDVYPYALHTSAISGQTALSEFGNLARSGFALIYQKADGTLRYEGRHARLLDTTSDWVLEDGDLKDLSLPTTRDELVNTVYTTIHPTIVDPLPTTLVYDQTNVISLTPGVPQFLLGPYRNPVTGDPIGATDVQAQVPGTDYLVNTTSDGSGTDVTADTTVAVTVGGSGAGFTITESSASSAYLTRNRLYGRGLYDQGTQQFQYPPPGTDPTGSIATNGVRSVTFDMPYQSDKDVGTGASLYVYNKYSEAFAQVRTVRVMAITPTLLAQVLTRDISDRLTIRETVTGVDSHYFINGIDLRVVESGHVEADYTLAPASDPFTGLYFILDTSALDTGVLAPF